ncbi:SETD4, partial [Symbiodinium sp. CCMP2456]
AIHPAAPAAVPRALPRPRPVAEGKSQQFCAPAASVAVLAAATSRAARTSRPARGGEESGRRFGEMVHWLKENGAQGLENIALGNSPMEGAGHGVFTAAGAEPGSRILSIPRACCIVAEDRMALAAALLAERKRGPSSPFAPLLATLPSARDLAAHPIFWPPGLSLRKILASCPHSCRMVYHMQLRASLEAAELVEHGAATSREEALWALALVESRAVTLTDEGPESPPWRLGLCPIIDFLNHQEPSEGAAPRCKLVDDVASGHVAVAAARTLEAGDELLFIYEECSSAQLFARYGFVQFPPAIPHPNERCLLNVPIADPSLPGGPEAAAARVAFARQSGWRRSAWRPLLLRMPYNAEEGGSLLPLARLALLPSADAVWSQGASCWNGRLPDAATEAQAEELARRWLTEAEAALTAARDELGALPSELRGAHPEIFTAVDHVLRVEFDLLKYSQGLFEESVSHAKVEA